MTSRVRFIPAILIALFALTSASNAQMKLGGHAGFDFDASDLFVGANVVIPAFAMGDVTLLGNADFSYWVTSDNYNLFIIDANVLYPFAAGPVSAYAGGGVAISFFSYDGPSFDDFNFDDLFSKTSAVAASSTDFGLNLKGGGEFGEGKMRPFGELGYYIKDGGFLYIQGGLRFLLGE